MRLPAFRSCMDELARETGYAMFTRAMLAHTVLCGETRRAIQRTIASAIVDGLLVRQCRGVYRYRYAAVGRRDLAQEVVLRCRPREFSYVSLESALVRFGVIEQAMFGGVTVMTTGRSQCLDTPGGRIELTHTAKRPKELAPQLLLPRRSMAHLELPCAAPRLALRELARVGRSLDLVVMENLEHAERELAGRC